MAEIVEKLKSFAKCLVHVLKIFLSYGDVVPEVKAKRTGVAGRTNQTQGNHVFNGVITSVQLAVVVLTAAFCVIMAPSMVQIKKITNQSTQLTLLILMVIGMTVMVGIYCFQDRLLRRRAKPNSVKGRLTLIGIVIFYTFGCIFDIFHLIKLYYCRTMFQRCDTVVKHSISAAFHVFRIIYLGSETLFCIMFRSAGFFDKCVVRYGLMILQATNLALWFDMLVRESKHRIRHTASTTPIIHGNSSTSDGEDNNNCLKMFLNSNFSEVSEAEMQCLNKNSTLHGLIGDYIGVILSPFSYELSILVGECLFEWFIHCRSTTDPPTSRHRDSSTCSASTSSQSNETSLMDVSRFRAYNRAVFSCPNERRLRPSRDASSSNSSSGSNSERTPLMLSSGEHRSNQASHSLAHLLGFLAGILLNLVYCILSFLPLIFKGGEMHQFNSALFYYSTFYWLSITATIFAGYYCSTAFEFCNKKLHSLDYILMFSSIGPYTYVVTALVVILRQMSNPAFEMDYDSNSTTYIILEISFMTSIYFQIPFTFQTGKVVIPKTEDSPFRKPDARVSVFKAILLHLAICNGTTWIVDTFTTAYNTDKVFIQVKYFSEDAWVSLNTFTLPLILFFRFNSCVLFISAYLRFKKLFQQAE